MTNLLAKMGEGGSVTPYNHNQAQIKVCTVPSNGTDPQESGMERASYHHNHGADVSIGSALGNPTTAASRAGEGPQQ